VDYEKSAQNRPERSFSQAVFAYGATAVSPAVEADQPQPGAVADFTFPLTGTLVRVVNEGADDGPWFVAADVARALGYRDATALVRSLDTDEKGTHIVSTPGGDQRLRVISVAGMYAAILSSRVEQAKPFRRWVTHDVLPTLLRTGTYDINAPEAQTEELAKLRRAFTLVQTENIELESENNLLGERCDHLGPRAVAAIGSEAEYGGQPVWDLRAALSGALEVGPRAVMLRLEELGVLVKEKPNAFRIQRAWSDLLFCAKTSRRRHGVTLHSVTECGTPMVWPGQQDAFLERIAEVQADRRRRYGSGA
jgi:prophage antirepressor-like protein